MGNTTLQTYETLDISEATALLTPEYVDCGSGERCSDPSEVVLIKAHQQSGVGKPLCVFTLGCAEADVLDDKVELYQSGELYVHPKLYDKSKKHIVDAMRKARR